MFLNLNDCINIGYGQSDQNPHNSAESDNQIQKFLEDNFVSEIGRTKSFEFIDPIKTNVQKITSYNSSFYNEDRDDPHYQFIIAKNYIEGTSNFKKNVDLGVKYLEKSISKGFVDSVIYYCQMLERGDVISRNLQKAKKCLSSFLKINNGKIFFLYGKILKKERKNNEALKYFFKGANAGDGEAMNEYGNMLCII